jgi:hypothetical protein
VTGPFETAIRCAEIGDLLDAFAREQSKQQLDLDSAMLTLDDPAATRRVARAGGWLAATRFLADEISRRIASERKSLGLPALDSPPPFAHRPVNGSAFLKRIQHG